MNSRSLLFAMTVTLIGAVPLAAHAASLFDFYGYSYSDGDPLVSGTVTTVPMRFNTIQPDPALPFDFSRYEVTAVVEGLTVAVVEDHGPVRTIRYDGGDVHIYQDAARNCEWAAEPPNGLVPDSFQNGELILIGHFTDCLMLYNVVGGNGTVQGHVTFTGGRRLGELPHHAGWLFFGGTTTRPQGALPAGYSLAWDPQLLAQGPVATRRSSWGTIKAIHR